MPYRSKEVYNRYKSRQRLDTIAFLGGECAHCGEDDPIVLTIDHIKDDGADERRQYGSMELCRKILKGAVDKARYQLLCCNCNWRKEYLRRTGVVEFPDIPPKRTNQHDGKTHCSDGHPFSEENTYIRRNGRRVCRICRRKFVKQNQKRRRERDAKRK